MKELIWATIGWVNGFFVGGWFFCKLAEWEAIQDGVGEYYLDENHKRQFRWKSK